MAKVDIYVVKPFHLKDEKGNRIEFSVGAHKVDNDIAEHWFVKPHLGMQLQSVDNDGVKTLEAALKAKEIEIAELNQKLELSESVIDDLKAQLQKAGGEDGKKQDSTQPKPTKK